MDDAEKAAREWLAPYGEQLPKVRESLAALLREREAAAWKAGAEAIREAAAKVADEADRLDPQSVYGIAVDIRALPIPEPTPRGETGEGGGAGGAT